MKKSKVTIECFEQDFDCYLSSGDWNGWALPNFERDEAFKLMGACNEADNDVKMLYDVETDTFYTDDGSESWKGFDYDGKHFYDIGSHSWCWWEVKEAKHMKKVKFSVACTAVYQGELEVDGDLTDEEILEEIHNRLDEIPVRDLEWVNDFNPEDAVTMEDIYNIEDIEEDE